MLLQEAAFPLDNLCHWLRPRTAPVIAVVSVVSAVALSFPCSVSACVRFVLPRCTRMSLV